MKDLIMEKEQKKEIELNTHNMKDIKIRLAGPVQKDSIVDGEGLRGVIWFQGCKHNCFGCHNPETHDMFSGIETSTSIVKKEIDKFIIQDGVTLSGGDPFFQLEAMLDICTYIKQKKLNIWVYTGYTFEEIIDLAKNNKIYLDILETIDVLVDGRFVLKDKSLSILFRGSTNQRIIDVKKSLKQNKTILLSKYRIKKSIKNGNKK